MIALRIAVAVLAALQAAIAAYLAFPGATESDGLKAVLVAVAAALAILINQLPRLQDRPGQSDGSWASSPKPPPRG